MKRAILMGPLADPAAPEWGERLKALKIRESDILYGVDRGTAHWVDFGQTPHRAVGDWDSLKERRDVLDRVAHLTLSKEKDRSDTWHALELALKAGARQIVGVGLTGGRADHHLAVLLDFMEVASGRRGPVQEVRLEGVDASYVFLSESIRRWSAKLPKGGLISIFAFGRDARGVTLRGLRYRLEDGALRAGSHGLSNEALGGPCEVRLRQGQLLVVIPAAGSEPA